MSTLSIGGVNFRVSCEPPLECVANDPAYREFVDSPYDGPDAVESGVLLRSGEPPPVGTELAMIFNTGDSWKLFGDGERHVFLLESPPDGGVRFWAAETDRTFRDFTITVNRQLVTAGKDGRKLTSVLQYPLDQVLLVGITAPRRGALIHAAGAVVEGKGLIFPGVSGAGKSTVSRLLSSNESFSLLSDDRIVVRRLGGEWKVFGTPWPGEAGEATNAVAPLSAVLFLEKGEKVDFRPLSPREVLKKLVQVVSIPLYDKSTVESVLATCGEMIESNPFFTLTFPDDSSVAHAVEEFAATLG